jgi:hypothetical protein
MPYCKRCDKKISSYGYCSTCQLVIKQDEVIDAIRNSQESYETGYWCIKCGHPVSDKAKFCPNCGDPDAGRKAYNEECERKNSILKIEREKEIKKEKEKEDNKKRAQLLGISLAELENTEKKIVELQGHLNQLNFLQPIGFGIMFLPTICAIITHLGIPGHGLLATFLAVPIINWFVIVGSLLFNRSYFLYQYLITLLILSVVLVSIDLFIYINNRNQTESAISELKKTFKNPDNIQPDQKPSSPRYKNYQDWINRNSD